MTAASTAGRSLVAAYGARISHVYGSVLNGYVVRAGQRQARLLAADPHVASVSQDSHVNPEKRQKNPPPRGIDRLDRRGLPLNRSCTSPGPGAPG
ncbi:hypothetical protein GCM10010121_067630 [Streptomyces brasiliensis]|uniref:Inhibitor I9 domain-containing protein n=1 Tax=Streptomyces brasiliensis TaxID=1954 RepID=A0A917P0E7_9ACTN|nr:hypothetical protein GCM10010121_067630 [Streptomyces brasiliensis]